MKRALVVLFSLFLLLPFHLSNGGSITVSRVILLPSNLSPEFLGFWPYWISTTSYSPSWGNLSYVAFFDVTANATGGLDTSNLGSTYYVVRNLAHSKGLKVLITVACFNQDTQDSILAYHKVSLVRNITYVVQRYGADGVLLDFEFVRTTNSITGKSNVWYMEWLINYLHDELKAINPRYFVGFTVAGGVETVYRNSNLSRYVDGVFLMGYDYHWSGSSTTGAVAPFEDSYEFDVSDSIAILESYYPRDKIILGAPLYGYDWPANSTLPGAATLGTGKTVLVEYAISNAATYGRHWDSNSHSPYYYYSLNGTWHQCWYDDNESLGLKFRYAYYQGLRGGGFWALGYEGTGSVWFEIWKTVWKSFMMPSRLGVVSLAPELTYSISSPKNFLPGSDGVVNVTISRVSTSQRVVLVTTLTPLSNSSVLTSIGWGINNFTVSAGSNTTVKLYVHVLGNTTVGTYNLTVFRVVNGTVLPNETLVYPVGSTVVRVIPRFTYNISTPQTVPCGDNFTLNITVKNAGSPVLHNITVTVEFPPSLNSSPSTREWKYLDPLTPHILYGLGVSHSFLWNVSALSSGTYTVPVIIHTDDGGTLYTNFTLEVVQPDLILTNITLPSPLYPNLTYRVNVTVLNNGTEASGSFNVSLYVNSSLLGSVLVDNLSPESATTVGFNWTPKAVGNYTLEAVADSNDSVAESNESNNILFVNVTVSPPPVPPRIVINEIMYYPPQGDNSYGEWIELYNPNNITVDLSSWWLGNGVGGYTFPAGSSIPPNGFLVVATNTTWMLKEYSSDPNFNPAEVYGNTTFVLNDTSDTVVLKSNFGVLVDNVTYDSSWGAAGDGKSLERISYLLPSNNPNNWNESLKLGGTPTYANTVSVPFITYLAPFLLLILLLAFKRR